MKGVKFYFREFNLTLPPAGGLQPISDQGLRFPGPAVMGCNFCHSQISGTVRDTLTG